MPPMNTAYTNQLWSRALVDALVSSGVRHACISPGSRSAPLTLAVAERDDVTSTVHYDERSAAFFALGYARATGRPAVLICTSGTAAANFLPAVIEAHYSGAPMILLTADRPPELRDTGAWQAIDQVTLYGGYVRWFADVATPSDEPGMIRYIRNLAGRAVAMACGTSPGPVHLNLPFREPLVPGEDGASNGEGASNEEATTSSRPAPDTVAATPRIDTSSRARPPSTDLQVATPEVIASIAAQLAADSRGLILAGQVDAPDGYAPAVADLARATGFPILAEPMGGLRWSRHDRSALVVGYDALLRVQPWAARAAPCVVLRLGASFTWKVVATYLEAHPEAVQIVIDPRRTWDDPTRMAALRLHVDPVPICLALTAAVDALRSGLPVRDAGESATRDTGDSMVRDAGESAVPDTGESAVQRSSEPSRWRKVWLEASALAEQQLDDAVASAPDCTVPWVYATLIAAMPAGGIVYAANSMAVRDLDTFTKPFLKPIRAIANRGAAGIDGTLSSAMGAAYGAGVPTVLVTGDLAFLHDLNGLAAAHVGGIRVTVVLLNDGGGGIFDYLPVAAIDPATFDRYFRTPSGADMASACTAFGVPHSVASSREAFRVALEAALADPGVQVIEVPIDPARNVAVHKEYWSAVATAVAGKGESLT